MRRCAGVSGGERRVPAASSQPRVSSLSFPLCARSSRPGTSAGQLVVNRYTFRYAAGRGQVTEGMQRGPLTPERFMPSALPTSTRNTPLSPHAWLERVLISSFVLTNGLLQKSGGNYSGT